MTNNEQLCKTVPLALILNLFNNKIGFFLVFHTAMKVTKIAEKYLTNVNGLCIFLHDCFLPSQYEKTQKAFY